ncbi:hydroxyphenylacetyl-CoA thioesterase PaaI [Cochlodiniinecator piscidefendens]|uniref:hydroxyphenylacetyl-CoA thioesterase PaaI n=1 Tax=Cochlodiniinecator piscidefendens TaxID=2715756 RepID=UPI00140B8FEA
MTPKQRAQRAADAMWAGDNASQSLGMEILDVDEGSATLALTVATNHANGHGICHGGITFALADSAFAFACNSRNQSTVAQHNVISYTAPAHIGDRLTATASEVSLTGRSGIYDVQITNQDNLLIAQFRGMSRAIKGQLFPETDGTAS